MKRKINKKQKQQKLSRKVKLEWKWIIVGVVVIAAIAAGIYFSQIYNLNPPPLP